MITIEGGRIGGTVDMVRVGQVSESERVAPSFPGRAGRRWIWILMEGEAIPDASAIRAGRVEGDVATISEGTVPPSERLEIWATGYAGRGYAVFVLN